ncbi:NEDD4-binding protein 1 [Mastacembelus armatus]|uniref:KH and NYN domain containing n=1 Tax=Mastacembelus armatus TaxID=205130 RepID=A0A3Q3M1V1_9TELE|nr:NEDD4-binding protein 1-like [Mastacembelus armatus]
MDGERSGEGGEVEVEDEFACAGMLRGSLTSLHGTVERIFRVTFRIGTEDLPHGNNGQIWLNLRGPSNDVQAAKLFVKGVVNQEEQQEVSYPSVLHCVFCGARGLFMDCLIKSTSAHIVVGSPGFLLISGLAEPVVRAYSLISELVERYEGTQSRRSETRDRGLGETLDSRRAFKTLVEKWEDRHVLDLLVLPGSVKEILLDLVQESGLGSSPNLSPTSGNARSSDLLKERWDKSSAITYTHPEPPSSTDRWVEGMTQAQGGSGKHSVDQDTFQCFATCTGARERAEGTEERLAHFPQEVGEGEQPQQRKIIATKANNGLEEEDEHELQLSKGNKEFWLLLKFFTAMGYTVDVVKRVLARTGIKEASQILDLVQQEQDRSDQEQSVQGGFDPKNHNGVILNQREKNRPCETEHREDEETATRKDNVTNSNGGGAEICKGGGDGVTGITGHYEEEVSTEEKQEGHEEDFVLGVLKKAAVSCGYTEQKVAQVYNMLSDRSTHQLLLELQKEGSDESDTFREGPREMDDVVLQKEGPKGGSAEDKETRESDDKGWLAPPFAEPDLFTQINKDQQLLMSQYTSEPKQHQPPHQTILPDVKGPPMSTYPTSIDPPLTNFHSNKQHGQSSYWTNPPTSKQNHQTQNNTVKLKPQAFAANNSFPDKAKEMQGFMSASSVVVTGEQRFLEGLQMPFDLQLTDKPGDPELRAIIIDGSNVAMSHGLGHFFSCRGIALAIQHFWDRGHRHISALLPQWRQKSDPRIKEQHYLTALQKLGLLSYTPSREFERKRITSYDDRFMLQLAQKTDGVIVTNDNLRDLLDESPVFRDIIKKRLLQYTFVGDHFMVPDDPLGRGGPHLDVFLRREHNTPDAGNHSFAGVANTFLSSKPPRSQTEVLNFRDRTVGGAGAATGGGGWGKGRGQRKGQDVGQHRRQHEAGGGGLGFSADRSPEETSNLREQLCQVFPGQDNRVTLVLQCHPAQRNINVLSDLILEDQD